MVVRNNNNSRILFMSNFAEQFHYLSASNAVKGGSGFIGKNQTWTVG